MIARVNDSRGRTVDEKHFDCEPSGNSLSVVLDWFSENYMGASEFGDGYECLVVDSFGEVVADFHT